MSIQEWSENILVAEMQDDPVFTDDMVTLLEQADQKPEVNVVLDLANVNHLNSSNIARLIDLHEKVKVQNRRQLVLCGVGTHVWGVLLVSELHKVFDFADDVSMGLAAVQLGD
jgi:anti-anti-sigma factor